MRGTVVGVLRGGPSREHEVSLRSGHAIMNNLSRERYTVRDIFIDRDGVWHERGLQTTPGKVLPHLDVAIISIHGAYGQDGEVQKVLEMFGVPYTGADPFHAFHASHKLLAKQKAKELGFLTPKFAYVENAEDADRVAREVVRTFHQPVIVKPVDSGSAVGVSVVGGYKQVLDAVLSLFEEGTRGVLIEERITGTEATVGIVEAIRGEDLYALPPVEIIPHGGGVFSYDAKYSGKSQEICPGRFTQAVTGELANIARTMHKELGQRHYSRSDFIVSKKGIYFLELNTAAAVGMTDESLMPKAIAAVGMRYAQFLDHLITLALNGKKRYSLKVPV